MNLLLIKTTLIIAFHILEDINLITQRYKQVYRMKRGKCYYAIRIKKRNSAT